MATDFKMWVGKQYYTLGSFIEEAMKQGVSKRIPASMIPEITPGESRLFLAYVEAIVILAKENYAELEHYLYEWGYLAEVDLECENWVSLLPELLEADTPMPPNMGTLRIALENLEATDLDHYLGVVDSFGITYKPGIFGYAYLTGIQYITKPGEEGLPQEYSHLEGSVEPVRVIPKE